MNDPNLIQLLVNIDHTFKLNLTKLYEIKIFLFFVLINKIHTEKQTEQLFRERLLSSLFFREM